MSLTKEFFVKVVDVAVAFLSGVIIILMSFATRCRVHLNGESFYPRLQRGVAITMLILFIKNLRTLKLRHNSIQTSIIISFSSITSCQDIVIIQQYNLTHITPLAINNLKLSLC